MTDSKQVTEKKRKLYIDYIKENALAYGNGIVSPAEIDEININQASKKAMLIALEEVRKTIPVDYLITDAMPIEIDIPSLAINNCKCQEGVAASVCVGGGA